MRKQTKLVAALSATALLAIGAAMTSYAAYGWEEVEAGVYVYYDKDGYQVTESWKKSGDNWYWLDEDGYMAANRLIENGDDNGNVYYVGDDGAMVSGVWVELENEEYYDSADEEESETNWYYFQASGKAYRSTSDKFKTINGKKYTFNEEGEMQYGWLDANGERIAGDEAYVNGVYYCGDADDGARVTKEWRYLYVGDDGPADSEDDFAWFYFDNKGKKLANVTKKINGKYYTFDESGMMLSSWQGDVATASELSGYFNGSQDGSRQKGWFQAVPDGDIDPTDNYNETKRWFYAMNDGSLVYSQIKTINGKKYAFNEDAEMITGLVALEIEDGVITSVNSIGEDDLADFGNVAGKVYYFGGSDDGAMKTGNHTIEIEGESYQFSFDKDGSDKGTGLNGKVNNSIYVNGLKLKADSDYRYQVVVVDPATKEAELLDSPTVNTTYGDNHYLVNTAGTIMRGTSYTNSDGMKYYVGANDFVTEAKWVE